MPVDYAHNKTKEQNKCGYTPNIEFAANNKQWDKP